MAVSKGAEAKLPNPVHYNRSANLGSLGDMENRWKGKLDNISGRRTVPCSNSKSHPDPASIPQASGIHDPLSKAQPLLPPSSCRGTEGTKAREDGCMNIHWRKRSELLAQA